MNRWCLLPKELLRRLGQGLSFSLIAAILYAALLSVSPSLHEHFHSDANLPGHECAVTLIASGKYQHTDNAAPAVVPPTPAILYPKVTALTPVWVPALYLRAALFEHAPPALS